MTGKTAEKKSASTRADASVPVDPRERALIVHTLAQAVYQHLAQQHARACGWGHTGQAGFHPHGQYMPPPMAGVPAPWAGAMAPWRQEMPFVPPHLPGTWGG